MHFHLLLTACINPDGMPFTKVSDKDVRMQQYRKALDFYLDETPYPIIFAENSNTDISPYYSDAIQSGRLEVLTFAGNDNKTKGKGYGEACIIEHVLDHSKMLTADSVVVKITGRLVIKNLTDVLTKTFPCQDPMSVICSFNADLSFPDSRLLVAPIPFLRIFLADKEQMNDNENVFFEHVLARTIFKREFPYAPFWVEPFITGISGSTGQEYHSPIASRSRAIEYKRMALHRYKLYAQKTGKHHLIKEFVYAMLRIKYHFVKY